MKTTKFLLAMVCCLLLSCDYKFCGDSWDTSQTEYELWSIDMAAFSINVVHKWTSSDFRKLPTGFKAYGFSTDGKNLYYTLDANRNPWNVHKLHLDQNSIEITQIDSTGSNFVLSPEGNFFAYSKNWAVWVSNLDGTIKYAVPKPYDGYYPLGTISWYMDSNRLVIPGHYPNTGESGIWIVNLTDSSYTKIFDGSAGYHYDFTTDASKITIASSYPSEQLHRRIEYKHIFDGELITIGYGNHPKFVNNDNSILYEANDGMYISTIVDGDIKKIFNKPSGGDRTRLGFVGVSNNHQFLAYSDNSGLKIYDTTIGEILFSVSSHESGYIPENNGYWDSITLKFSHMIFSRDNSKVYFLTQKHFQRIGC